MAVPQMTVFWVICITTSTTTTLT